MEEIVSLSMAGIYSLLILNLTFLFLLGMRVHVMTTKILEIEKTMNLHNRLLKERIEILEKT